MQEGIYEVRRPASSVKRGKFSQFAKESLSTEISEEISPEA
jgi:hypothetical protein